MSAKSSVGFTLIELTISIAIIGMLAALAVPAYTDYLLRSRVAEAFNLSQEPIKKITEYYAYHGRLPLDNETAGLPMPSVLQGRYVKEVRVEQGAVHIMLHQPLYSTETNAADDAASRLSIRPALPAQEQLGVISAVHWVCGYATPLANYAVNGTNKTNIGEDYLPYNCQAKFL